MTKQNKQIVSALPFSASAIVAYIGASGAAVAQAPAPNSQIRNVANATYFNVDLGILETTNSNVVTSIVNEVQSFEVTFDQEHTRAPGDLIQLGYTITNTGNADTLVSVDFNDFEGTYDFSLVDVVLDSNGNGRVDPTDPVIDPNSPLPLLIDSPLSVLVELAVPVTATSGDWARGNLIAELTGGTNGSSEGAVEGNPSGESTGGPVESAYAIIHVLDQSLELRKSVDIEQNGDLTYTLSLRNNSETAFEPSNVFDGEPMLIDGVGQPLVILRDRVPLNTEFVRIVDAVDFYPVFHLSGSPENEWTVDRPTDRSLINAIAFVSDEALSPGESRDFQFSVQPFSAGGDVDIENIAEVLQPDGNGNYIPEESNLVSTPLTSEVEGAIEFFTSEDFDTQSNYLGYGKPTFLELSSGTCNTSSDIDVVTLMVETNPDGDREYIQAIETGPNTGIFRTGALDTALAPPVLKQDGILQGSMRSLATASADCDPAVEDKITIAPSGFLFLSTTNETMAGVTINLLDESGQIVQSTVTATDGSFELIPLDGGMYTLDVQLPTGYVAPSVRRTFPGFGRRIELDASYSLPFSISAAGVPLSFDVPVDPDMNGSFAVDKTASRDTASIGEAVQYSIEIRNASPIAIDAVEVEDILPPGLTYLEGSSRLDGVTLSDPSANGRTLTFDVGLMRPNTTKELIYTAKVNTLAQHGDVQNLAFARGTFVGLATDASSNLSSHTLKIDNHGGVFSTNGTVLGKVFLDCDGDGEQRGDEPGIPGVMIHTDQGQSVVTDSDGRYSFTDLSARRHVLDLYDVTLPEGSEVRATTVMDAGQAGSRLVPLRMGEIRSEEFAVGACSQIVVDEVKVRRERAKLVESGKVLLDDPMQFGGRAKNFSVEHSQQADGAEFGATQTAETSTRSINRVELGTDLEALLIESDDVPTSFIDLSDGDQVIQQTIAVRVQGPSDLVLTVEHNGRVISDARVGRAVSNTAHQIQEYIAVRMQPGSNTLTVKGTDPFGNIRTEESISISAPGEAARLHISAPPVAVANPNFEVPIVMQVVDAAGRPTSAPLEVTLAPGDDIFDVEDENELLPGVQKNITDGESVVALIPADKVGTRNIKVYTPLGDEQAEIKFVADTDSENIAVAHIEGSVNLSGNSITEFIGDDRLSVFEETKEGVEASGYVKGEFVEDVILTARYDSDRSREDEYFRSSNPDEFYPTYGDRSTHGFDARSQGKAFVRVEKDSSFVQYGDVIYESQSKGVKLGQFRRTIEGGFGHLEAGRLTIDAYAGETDLGQQVMELPAEGISGPYDLVDYGFSAGDIVFNTEIVELITYDRDQSNVVIKTERLSRFRDYTVDYFSGTLLFARAVSSRDDELNPIAIRVTFETSNDAGDKYSVYGGEVRLDVSDSVDIGVRQLTSDAPLGDENRQTVRSAYAEIDLSKNDSLELEVAQSVNALDEDGLGYRAEFQRQFDKGVVGVRAITTDETFENTGASTGLNRTDVQVTARRSVGDSGQLSGEAIYSEAKSDGSNRTGAVVRYENRISDNLRMRAGSRVVRDESETAGTDETVTGIIGFNYQPEFIDSTTLDVEFEQELTKGSNTQITFGADYVPTTKWRYYAQGQYSGTRSGNYGFSDSRSESVTLRAGAEYQVTDNVNAFSEYRATDNLSDAGMAQGVTARWDVSPEVNIRARAEHVQPIGENFRKNTAASVGFTLEPEENDQIFDTDLDYSVSDDDRHTWYSSASYGRQWDDVTFLVRNRFARSYGAGEERTRDRLRLGWAHRPVKDDALNTLSWYEFQLEDEPGLRDVRHMWSIGGERKPEQDLRLRGRLAGQYYSHTNAAGSLEYDEVSFLAQAGVDMDVSERVNLATYGTTVTDGKFENSWYGVGGEVNVNVFKGAILGLGYSHLGVERESLKDLYRDGWYLRFNMKMTDDVWNIFGQE